MKIFCIGKNKTGTCSLEKALQQLGYKTGKQNIAEGLMEEYYKENFDKIIEYCQSAEAFQDVPFSCPETYKYLDKTFPDAKFILSIRTTEEIWYSSLVGFYTRLFGENLKYGTPWILRHVKEIYKTSDKDRLNKDKCIDQYKEYNENVKNYFQERPDKLLIVDLSDEHSYKKFCDFLNKKSNYKDFPWENRTK